MIHERLFMMTIMDEINCCSLMEAALGLAAWFISLSVILRLDLDMKATLKNITAALLEDRRLWFPQDESKALNESK